MKKNVRILRIFSTKMYKLNGFFSENVRIFVRIFSKSFGHPADYCKAKLEMKIDRVCFK